MRRAAVSPQATLLAVVPEPRKPGDAGPRNVARPRRSPGGVAPAPNAADAHAQYGIADFKPRRP